MPYADARGNTSPPRPPKTIITRYVNPTYDPRISPQYKQQACYCSPEYNHYTLCTVFGGHWWGHYMPCTVFLGSWRGITRYVQYSGVIGGGFMACNVCILGKTTMPVPFFKPTYETRVWRKRKA